MGKSVARHKFRHRKASQRTFYLSKSFFFRPKNRTDNVGIIFRRVQRGKNVGEGGAEKGGWGRGRPEITCGKCWAWHQATDLELLKPH
jgi:hypothetical protein